MTLRLPSEGEAGSTLLTSQDSCFTFAMRTLGQKAHMMLRSLSLRITSDEIYQICGGEPFPKLARDVGAVEHGLVDGKDVRDKL